MGFSKGQGLAPLLGLLGHHNPNIFRLDALVLDQVLLELYSAAVALVGSEVHRVADNPLHEEAGRFMLASFHRVLQFAVKKAGACAPASV